MSRWLRSNSTLSGAAICAALMFSSLLVPSAKPQASNSGVKGAASLPPAAPSANPPVKPEPKKAKEAYKRGLRAEQAGDWKTAHEDYADAVDWAPTEREYLLRRETAKSHLVQANVDLAERDAVSGRLKEARRELIAAAYLDPTNRVVRDRLTELTALEPDTVSFGAQRDGTGGRSPDPIPAGNQKFRFPWRYSGRLRRAGAPIRRRGGIRRRSAPADHSIPTERCRLPDRGAAARRHDRHVLAAAGTAPVFCEPGYAPEAEGLSAFGSSEHPAAGFGNRRADDGNSAAGARHHRHYAVESRHELANDYAARFSSGRGRCRRSDRGFAEAEWRAHPGDGSSRSGPQCGPAAGDCSSQTSQILSLNTQQIQEAQQSVQGLVSVITQLFGQPFVAFGAQHEPDYVPAGVRTGRPGFLDPAGGGPGGRREHVSRHGSGSGRQFLRDAFRRAAWAAHLVTRAGWASGHIFRGPARPGGAVNFSASLSGTGDERRRRSHFELPDDDYDTGNGPTFVSTGSLRNNGDDDFLIVSNFTDSTISGVLLGNGDGTFATQTTFPTGAGPVWDRGGQFCTDANNQNIDLAMPIKLPTRFPSSWETGTARSGKDGYRRGQRAGERAG